MTSLHRVPRVAATGAFALACLGGLTCCETGEGPRTSSSSSSSLTGDRYYGYSAPERGSDQRSARSRSGDLPETTMYYPTGRRESSVLQMKVTGPSEVALGRSYSYNVQVTNLTPSPLTNVVVRNVHSDTAESSNLGYTPPAQPTPRSDFNQQRDSERQRQSVNRENDLDQGSDDATDEIRRGSDRDNRTREFAQNTPTARDRTMPASTSQAEWTIGHLNPGETKTFTIEGEAREMGQIRQCLAAEFTPTICTVLNVVNPQLQATVKGPEQALICDDLEYTFAVRNVGTGVARNVRIAGALPEGLNTRDGQREMSYHVGDLAAGESRDVRVRFRPASSGQFTVQPRLVSDAGETQVQAITTTVQQPTLQVQVDGPQWQYIGQPVSYKVTVTNSGDGPANDTVLELNARGMTGDFNSRNLGTLAPGETKTVDLNVQGVDRTLRQTPQEVRFNVMARARCAESVTGSALTQMRTISALLLETVDTVDPVQIGQTTVYEIAVRNQGSGPANNVRLVARLPKGLEYVSATGDSAVRAEGQNLTFEPVQQLPAGATAKWSVTARATGSEMVQFELELRSDELVEPAVENEPTRLYDPNRPAPDAQRSSDNPPRDEPK